MKPYGSVRTYANCRVIRAYAGTARKIKVAVKNHKADRAAKIDPENS